jgi:hypothetical protein
MDVAGFLIIAFLSDMAGTVAGFGSSTIFLPFALLFHPFPEALFLVACAHVFGNIGRVGFFRAGLDRALLARFGLPSVAFSLLGALLVPHVPQQALKTALGAFVAAYAAATLLGYRSGLRPSPAVAVSGGVLSGFFAGILGTGGALRGAFLSAFNLPKETYIATAAAIAIATDLTRIPAYAAQGVDAGVWRVVPMLLVTSLAGAWVGRRLVRKLPAGVFRAVVAVALLAIGLKLASEAFL